MSEKKLKPKLEAISLSDKIKTETLVDGSVKKQILDEKGDGLAKILAKCRVDAKLWEVNDFNIKELSNGEFLWTLYLKKKSAAAFNKIEFLKELKDNSPVVKPIKYPKTDTDLLLEISIFDAHIGKFSWNEETGQNYNLRIASDLYRKAVDYTLAQAEKHSISRILFPIGQDYLHIDGKNNMTTAGTPQDSDTRASKIFITARQLLIESIEKMKSVAPVDIISIPGNHEENSMFHLADCIECRYHNDVNVSVHNSPKVRKYYQWGKNLIGFTHGDKERINDLAVLMASEASQSWAQCKYKIWKLGHFHTNKMYVDEKCGVIIEVLPSLSATDAWHSSKGYVGNARGSVSSIYSKEKGLVNKIYYNV